ncbi:MAG: hypothetical protein Q4D27_07495 [Coriobacteriia bacterium]|nr:hypothetical protein [Coriobacteriia bacterium]
MPERKIDPNVTEVPEMPQVLSSLLAYVVEEGQKKFDEDGDLAPFTAVAVADTLFFEPVEGETPDEMYAFAKHTVEHVRGADAYALCYDGYLDTDKGKRDAIIAEGGVPGAIQGEAVGLVYDVKEDGVREYHRPIAYIGKAPNFMIFLTEESDPRNRVKDEDEFDFEDEAEAEAPAQETAE